MEVSPDKTLLVTEESQAVVAIKKQRFGMLTALKK